MSGLKKTYMQKRKSYRDTEREKVPQRERSPRREKAPQKKKAHREGR